MIGISCLTNISWLNKKRLLIYLHFLDFFFSIIRFSKTQKALTKTFILQKISILRFWTMTLIKEFRPN